MRGVADLLRAEDREAIRALSVDERVALALALGNRDLEAYRLSHAPPLEPTEAARRLDRRRQAGRRRSGAIEALIG